MIFDLPPNSPEPTREARRGPARTNFRSVLFEVVEELTRSEDEQLRLRASLGGLRALAHLESLELRERRLEQHDQMIALAEKHLALQQQRAAAKAPSPATRGGGGGGQVHAQHEPGGGSTAATSPTPEPLNSQELAELEELIPHIPPKRFRTPSAAELWRSALISTRFWDAYWKGHNAATKPNAKPGTRIPGTDPDYLEPDSPCRIPAAALRGPRAAPPPAPQPAPSEADLPSLLQLQTSDAPLPSEIGLISPLSPMSPISPTSPIDLPPQPTLHPP